MSDFQTALQWVKDNSGSENPDVPSRTPSYGNCSINSMLGVKPFIQIPEFVLEHVDDLILVLHSNRFENG